ncbi:MAG: hypothetical protein ACRDP7_18520 [Trebonia sp.]
MTDFTIVNVALPSIQRDLHVVTTTLQWTVSARSRALGTYGAVVSAGFASGAVLGGLLAEVTWRLVFLECGGAP